MEIIHVLSSADDRYAQHLGVMLTSLLANTGSSSQIQIYILDGGLSTRNQELLNLSVSQYGRRIKFLTVPLEYYERFAVRSYFGQATYLRLFIPELLDDSIGKVLYFDCDLVIKGDIAKLWEIDISQYLIAAVEDAGQKNRHYGLELKRSLGIPDQAKYFNAGVLIINLTGWRRERITAKICDFLIRNSEKVIFCDQDGLNAVVADRWLPLPVEWNQQTHHYELYQRQKTREEIQAALQNPLIIHYTTGSKPWHYLNTHPLKHEYYHYLNLTPWKGYVPADRTLGNLFFKYFPGKLLAQYLQIVKIYYTFDRSLVPEWLNRRWFFKLLYLILFPVGMGYLKLVGVSYYLEYQKVLPARSRAPVGTGGSIRGLGWRLLNLLIYPARYLTPNPLKERLKELALHQKGVCPCCGYRTLKTLPHGPYGICEICGWEDDPVQSEDPDYTGGANEISLRQARQNFCDFGAYHRKSSGWVRKPGQRDEREENWITYQ